MGTKAASAWFETLYNQSQRDHSKIPWAQMQPNKFLPEYLQLNVGQGKAIVIGCGLGDDAVALCEAGFDVTAIDISESAIAWCQERFDYTDVDFRVQDIYELPEEMLGQYDFVFESRTIQSLPLEFRDKMIRAISSLVAPAGKVLAVANGKNAGEKYVGPPWPLERNELRLFGNYDMNELEFSIFSDDTNISTLQFRALFQKQRER